MVLEKGLMDCRYGYTTLLMLGSVENSHRPAGPRPTTLEDRELQFHVYDLQLKAWGSTTFFFTEFQTLMLGRH